MALMLDVSLDQPHRPRCLEMTWLPAACDDLRALLALFQRMTSAVEFLEEWSFGIKQLEMPPSLLHALANPPVQLFL